ncbi:polysaccharide deacetylase family protein [Sphingobacterium hungaricum]|uniref:NodB homology domain-containing protein n=1 Tax=Sphingobacterium hungaricum TaxID=2082723 RepID=A0A928V2C5_9SPHI|nr:hypothetical protein [Sphingobacterium hungaricum]
MGSSHNQCRILTKCIVFLFIFVSCQPQTTTNKQTKTSNEIDTPTEQPVVVIDPLTIDSALDALPILPKDSDSLRIVAVKDTVPKKPLVLTNRKITDSLRRVLDTKPKHIYLTFDDGPLIGSRAIDSIITARNIKINAFLIGKHAHMSKHLNKSYQIYYNNPLVDCYNHSFTHANNRFQFFYSNPQSAFEDFDRNEKDLELKYKIVRMPGRNIWYFDDIRRVDLSTGGSTADMLYSHGYKIYGWDVEWRINGVTGKPVQTVDQVYTRIKNYMNNKSSLFPNNVVLLMHDDMFQNKLGQKQLSALLDSLQQHKDYTFEFMRDYPFKY